MSLLEHSLPYHPNSTKLFERICHQPWAMFLDSGKPVSQYGRYDILVANPFMTICTNEGAEGSYSEIMQGGIKTISQDDPFDLVDTALAGFKCPENAYPFCGGAVGYFGYDLAREVEDLPSIAKSTATPSMMIGLYDWAVIVDHRQQIATLVSHGTQQSTLDQWQDLCHLFESEVVAQSSAAFEVIGEVTSNMTFDEYASAFHAIKQFIREGDCYQVNLAQRFAAPARGDSWQAYQKLRELSPAPFMSYMNFGDWQVLSGSPERFLQVTGRHVETRPIKGTRPRAEDAAIDYRYAQELQNSIKDRAENLMIVDLLRNDISKNCEIGSVKADKLFQLQSFANVHHLVSFVTGKLQQGRTAIQLLRGCFPGGSITGAPKLRSMQIIEALEKHRRGVYCGAIGYIGFDGNMDTNIAIRTAVFSKQSRDSSEISFYAGGGIVADSELEKEYAETLDKASSMLKTMRFFQGSD